MNKLDHDQPTLLFRIIALNDSIKFLCALFVPVLIVFVEALTHIEHGLSAIILGTIVGSIFIATLHIHWIPKIILLLMYIPTMYWISIYFSFAFAAIIFNDFL